MEQSEADNAAEHRCQGDRLMDTEIDREQRWVSESGAGCVLTVESRPLGEPSAQVNAESRLWNKDQRNTGRTGVTSPLRAKAPLTPKVARATRFA